MTSPKQRAFLRRMYARRNALVRSCDCPGCDTCKGFIKACTCDEPSSLREALGLPHPTTASQQPKEAPEPAKPPTDPATGKPYPF